MTHLPTDDMHHDSRPRTRGDRRRARHAAAAGAETVDAGLTMPLTRAAASTQAATQAATHAASAPTLPRRTAETPHSDRTMPLRTSASAPASTEAPPGRRRHAFRTDTTATRSSRRGTPDSKGLGLYLRRTLAALVLPGGGLLLTGRDGKPARLRPGLIMAGLYLTALLILIAAALIIGPAKFAIAVATRTPLLLTFLALHLVALVAWCASIVVTARDNTPGTVKLPRYLTVGWVGLLCTILIAPTAAAGWFGHTTLSSMAGIHYNFGTKADGPNGTVDNPWAGTPRVNVLIIGSDAGDDRYSFRTDAMMVASIDTTTGKTALFGIPRQLQGFTLRPSNPLYQRYGAKVSCPQEQAGECMLNAMSVRAMEVKDQFPPEQQANAGVVTITEILEDLLNLKINNTVVMQMRGLTDTVEALGGVNVNVKQRLPIGGRVHNNHIVPGSIYGWIEPGLQRLNGEQAKWYARSRATTDNDDRMNRQRCLVGSLVKQITPAMIMANYGKLTQVLLDNVKTDINLNPTNHNGLPAWLSLLDKVRSAGKMTSINFIEGKTINTVHPKYDEVHAIVAKATSGVDAPNASPTSADAAAASPTPTDTPTTTSHRTRTRHATPSESATPAPADVDLAKGC